MGLMDRLPFGKKKDDFPALAEPMGSTFTSPQDPLAVQPSSFAGSTPYPSYQSYPQGSPMYPSAQQDMSSSRDIEVLKAKMDAIQATLESLNQRFANIERFINDTGRRRW